MIIKLNMHFCIQCNNMYYMKLSGGDNNTLVYYCRNCGHENTDLAISDVCVSSTVLKQTTQKYAHTVNEYTKIDPTLPRTNAIRCPNQECESNTKNDVPREVIYLRYDDQNMKYLYVCTVCNTTWKTDEIS